MPKSTFFNLKQEKIEKIEKALIKEFSRNSFEQASISNIIREAKIPRGSFYQYFEDKEDAIKYVIKKFIILEHNKIYNFLLETKGDIFEVAVKIYDDTVDIALNKGHLKLIKNILQELRKNNINIFDNHCEIENRKQIDQIINTESLNIEKQDDLKYIMKILTTVTRTMAMEVISNKLLKEEGREELIREIEILKKGMKK
ncbi:MAG: TetR family transcriptional regulator [Clostridia bacterium]